MSKTEVSGKQVKDGSIELVDLSANLASIIDGKADVGNLAAVATSGSYNDLTNKPSLFSGAYADLTGKPSLAAVATSGSYNDLSDKPKVLVPTKEILTGLVDGVKTEFLLSNTPHEDGYVQVFLNGLLQSEGATEDYTISGNTIIFNSAPDSGWKLVVFYFL